MSLAAALGGALAALVVVAALWLAGLLGSAPPAVAPAQFDAVAADVKALAARVDGLAAQAKQTMAAPDEDDKLSPDWKLDETAPLNGTSPVESGEALSGDWEKMLADEKAADADGADRVLNQDEIDSLLGFDPNAGGTVELTGVQALINSALVSYERLPMLEIVFDRLVRLATTSLRNFTSDNVEVTLESISSVRFGDYLNSIPLPAILGVIKAEEWDNFGLLTVDSGLIYAMIDVLLGGRRQKRSRQLEPVAVRQLGLPPRALQEPRGELPMVGSLRGGQPVQVARERLLGGHAAADGHRDQRARDEELLHGPPHAEHRAS